MSWMHGLRMFTDLSFYAVFAGSIVYGFASHFGSSVTGEEVLVRSVLGLLWLSVIYGSSFRFREKKQQSRLLLALLLAAFVAAWDSARGQNDGEKGISIFLEQTGRFISGILEGSFDFFSGFGTFWTDGRSACHFTAFCHSHCRRAGFAPSYLAS